MLLTIMTGEVVDAMDLIRAAVFASEADAVRHYRKASYQRYGMFIKLFIRAKAGD